MSLVRCPKCGKENVSESAKVCPNCGFSIADYYENESNKETGNKKNANKIILLFIVIIIVIIWGRYFFSTRCEHEGCYSKRNSDSMFCSYHQEKINSYSSNVYSSNNYSYSSSNSSSKKTDSSTIFNNLEITDFSSKLSTHWGEMQCQVTNNNSFTVNGYFYVNFYDSNNVLLYCQLMPLSEVGVGEKVSCSTLISKDDYPKEYDHVDFSQSILTKSN